MRIKAIILLAHPFAGVFMYLLRSLLLPHVFYQPLCHVQNSSEHPAAAVSIKLPVCSFHFDCPI